MDGDLPACVHAAAEEVDGEARQRIRSASQHPGEMLVEGQAALLRASARECDRDRQDSVRAETGFVRRAVQFDQGMVQLGLIGEAPASQCLMDFAADICDGFAAAEAPIALRIAIAKFQRLGRAGGGARGNRGGCGRAARQGAGCTDSRTTPAVQNFGGG